MINYLKDKYYWHITNSKLQNFLESNNEQKILLYGYPKSGNTWLRFFLYNYRNLLLDSFQTSTISYDKLNLLQNNVMDRGTTFTPQKGFPIFYRTHKIYMKSYDLFSKKIFIHRNPLDTLISAYYFYKNRRIPFSDDRLEFRKRLDDIDFYVCYKINTWITFYNISIVHADFVMNYTEMKNNPGKHFSRLLRFLEWNFDDELVEKSINFSTYNKVKEMGEEKSQEYGNGPKDGSFIGKFTRSGDESQFNYELKEETISFVLEKFPKFKQLYPNLIE